MAAEAVHPAVGNAFGGWYPERVGHAATPVLSCSCAGLCRSSLGFTLAPFAAGAPLLRVTHCRTPPSGRMCPGGTSTSSSAIWQAKPLLERVLDAPGGSLLAHRPADPGAILPAQLLDRKSTRLNSSHVRISYAVFCLKKKKKQNKRPSLHTTRET